MHSRRRYVIGSILTVLLLAGLAPAKRPPVATPQQFQAIQRYIHESWSMLQRSQDQLLAAAVDPKLGSRERWPVYVSRKEDIKQIESRLAKLLPGESLDKIELRRLPRKTADITEHGLLYLPYSYVVPGGRFNEMYGWDSYFIQVGLLRDGELKLAKNMIDNFLYQIEHYGKILNANRTYFLTRSQPPFLTEMILGVFQRTKDKGWLANSIPAIEKYYRFWTTPPHLVQETGLSRYYDTGHGPAPEVVAAERNEQGRTHYNRVKEYYRTHKVPDYDVTLYYSAGSDHLTDVFYVGDRSMRESGFDPSNRFGPFNIDIISYNPVCLNSLLYRMEVEAADIQTLLGNSKKADQWKQRAAERKQRINRFLWDEKTGLYLDYNFTRHHHRYYPFATTFYPLWAGVASAKQAERVVSSLPLLERPGGLMTSTQVTGSQWDAPFGWAPLQMLAVKGLRRYGYAKPANRITLNFLSLVLKEFIEHNTIVEKYDVVRRQSDVSSGLRFGYSSNEIGFGWTNAAFVELYADLPKAEREKVLHLGGVPVPLPVREQAASAARGLQ